MLSAQRLLPHLPVPKLSDSLSRYLRAVRPLLNDTEYANTKRIVNEFSSSKDAAALQGHLEKRAASHDNWLAEYWINTGYLDYRAPILLFSNPSYFLPRQSFSSDTDQFRFASGVISAALEYRKKLVNDEFEPEFLSGNRPLCMSQYTYLFDGCRVPEPDRDRLVYPSHVAPSLSDPAKTDVVLIFKNRFYNLNVDLKSSDPQSVFDSISPLQHLRSSSDSSLPVGILTAWHRDKWTAAHKQLENVSELNALNLNKIRQSAFILCLDSHSLKPVGESSSRMEQVLHGGGSSANTGNRWFDKTVQFIVSPDGAWGVCQEHAPCEAIPVVALADYVAKTLIKEPQSWRNLNETGGKGSNLKPLEFRLNEELKECILTATRDTDKLIADVQSQVYIYDGWGRNGAKAMGITADSFVQLAIHMAYYQLNGRPASGYESGSLRRFLLGRTDTIRPCSIESLALFETLCSDKKLDMDEAKKLMKNALASHREYLGAAMSGRGFDRHFLGLKFAARELNLEQPPIFNDIAYQKAMHYVLSTSQVSSNFDDACMGYAPLCDDGYGCCYSIRPDRVVFGITAWRSCSSTDANHFAVALSDAMTQLIRIAGAGSSSPRPKTAPARL